MHPLEVFDNIVKVVGFADLWNPQKDDKFALSKKFWPNGKASVAVR